MPSRGAVGQAAEKLKASLALKLGASNELDASVRRALSMVEAFLDSSVEDAAAWESLKINIRHCIVTQGSGPTFQHVRKVASAPNGSSPDRRSRPIAVQLPKPDPGSLRKSLPTPTATQGGDKVTAFPWLAKGNTGRPLKATNVPRNYKDLFDTPGGPTMGQMPDSPTRDSQAVHSMRSVTTNRSLRSDLSSCSFSSEFHSDRGGAPIWGGSRRVTIPDTSSRAVLYSSMVGSNTELDFTLPKHTLRPKAFVNANSVYDQMVRDQDKLAAESEEYMKHMEEEKIKRTRATYDEQYGLVKKRLQEEVEAKKIEAREMNAKIQLIKEEDEAQRQEEERAYQAVRATVNEQVAELREFRRLQEEQRQRGIKLDRMHADLLANREKERLAQLAAEHRLQLKQVEAELNEILRQKAVAQASKRVDEQLYNSQRIKLADEAEARRQAAVAAHAAKLKVAFERGGGEQLMVDWNAKMVQEREKVALELGQQELRAQAKDKARVAARQGLQDDFINGLNGQIAYKEASRRRTEGVKERERLALQAKLEEQASKDEAAVVEERERQLRHFAELKSVAAREAQRIVALRSVFPGDEANMWVHRKVVNGTTRGFTNLSVPEKGNRITLPRRAEEASAC